MGADEAARRGPGLVQRGQLWNADIAYVAASLSRFYMAFVIDMSCRAIGRWHVSRSLRSDLALDQPNRARPSEPELIHPSDDGVQQGIERSASTVGGPYENEWLSRCLAPPRRRSFGRWALARNAWRGMGNSGVGGRVQQPQDSRADRTRITPRERRRVSSVSGGFGHGRRLQQIAKSQTRSGSLCPQRQIRSPD